MSEDDRIAFLVGRDGENAARAWAVDTLRTYRLVVLRRHSRWRKPGQHATHTIYRRPMIESYLSLKRFYLK